MPTSCWLQITANVAIIGNFSKGTKNVHKLLVGAGILQ